MAQAKILRAYSMFAISCQSERVLFHCRYLYNGGDGKWIHCVHLACLRNRSKLDYPHIFDHPVRSLKELADHCIITETEALVNSSPRSLALEMQ